jgi:hypothetical protein
VLEMTVIMPLIVAVVLALVITGITVYERCAVSMLAERMALLAARSSVIPGYPDLFASTGIGPAFGFGRLAMAEPGTDALHAAISDIRPYRYLTGEAETCEKLSAVFSVLAGDVCALPGNYDCTVAFVVRSGVRCAEVRVTGATSVLGDSLAGKLAGRSIRAYALAPVCDGAEFVRNTDLIFDVFEDAGGMIPAGKDGNLADKVRSLTSKIKGAVDEIFGKRT